MRVIGHVGHFSKLQARVLLCVLFTLGTAIFVRLFGIIAWDISLSRLLVQYYRTEPEVFYFNSSNNEFRFFAFSAFYDDRPSLLSPPVVRIIAVSDVYAEFRNRSTSPLYCILRHDERDAVVRIEEVPQRIGYGWPLNDLEAMEYVYTCPTMEGMMPKSVSITTRQNEYTTSGVPVIYPAKPKSTRDFCACVQAVYGTLDPYRIIEWLELQRILGVSLVGVYILSAPESVLKVFERYADEKFVDLRRINYIYSNDSRAAEFWLHLTPTINDCLYRHMYECRRTVVIDFDEFIMPRRHSDLRQLVDQLERSVPESNFAFRNNYFFLDLKADDTLSKYLTFLRFRNKVKASGEGYAEKSIVNPQACTHMHNHCCWGVTKNYSGRGITASVDPGLALNQHYKKCHLSRFECEEMMKSIAEDDVLMPFKEILIRNVNRKVKEIMGHEI